jgi:protein-S-isoprenylcysteine O-methyltransferase Ste14
MSRLPSLGPRGEGWVLVQGVLFVLVAAAGVSVRNTVPSPMAELLGLAGTTLVLLGLGLALAASGSLGRGGAFSALPRPRAGAALVASGPYRLVRHPIYGGIVIAAFGWAIARHSLLAGVLAALLLAFFDLKRRREEAWLEARFPAYAGYAARTRRMIPWLY